MNTANKLTAIRVLLIPAFMVFLYISFELGRFVNNVSIALAIFCIAAMTDLADGLVARKQGQVTDLGTFMDPLADKVLTFAALLWFIEAGLMPVWLVLVVIIREFMVTGLRLVAAAKGSVISASLLGKAKTLISNCCIIGIFLIYLFVPSERWLLYVCWGLVGTSTVVSGVEYFVKNRVF